MLNKNLKLLLIIFFIILNNTEIIAANINDKEFEEIGDDYDGPQVESKNMEIIYSEEAKMKARVTATIVQQFKNKDAIYPEGIFVEFYDKEEKITGTLKANYVKYNSKKNIYTIKGNVEVKNMQKNEILQTTELTWLPDDQKIYTERFVKIQTADVSLIGKGIDAKEDLSRYKILEPHGSIKIRKKEPKLEEKMPIGYKYTN